MKQRLTALLLLLALLLLPGCGAAQSGVDTAAREEAIMQAAQSVDALFEALEDEAAGDEAFAAPSQEQQDQVFTEADDAPAPDEEAATEEAEEAQVFTEDAPSAAPTGEESAPAIDEAGSYTSKEDVALYLYTYGHLPDNFITKKQAQALGWEGGSLEPYAPGKCIGGSRFGNYEGLLPEAEGRTYTECDIDTLGADRRGAKRIVFSNDGLIYYTDDHYESFTLLYPEAS